MTQVTVMYRVLGFTGGPSDAIVCMPPGAHGSFFSALATPAWIAVATFWTWSESISGFLLLPAFLVAIASFSRWIDQRRAIGASTLRANAAYSAQQIGRTFSGTE